MSYVLLLLSFPIITGAQAVVPGTDTNSFYQNRNMFCK